MDYLTLRKRTVFKRYHDSDIFNVKGESKNNKSALPQKNRTTQGSLEKTKNDLFNTLGNEKSVKIKPLKKKIYIQNYLNTDIFNVHLNESDKKKKSKPRIKITASTCFNGVLNNEEYTKDLKDYTKLHRSQKKDYEVDQYFNNISAIGRYYNEMYGDEKSGIFPQKNRINSKTLTNSPNKGINSDFQNNQKNFENRKKKYKKELININNYGVDGKKRIQNGIDKNIRYNKKKIDLYGLNSDNKNNREFIKEKNGIEFNSKLKKQLENQSNIFDEQNKDINTKMSNYIKNKKEEKEKKKKLEEKITKEKEEIDYKIKEQNIKNLCLNRNIWGGKHSKWQTSNMSWTDQGAQILFKKSDKEADFDNMTAFQRKLKDIADSDNIDILSEKLKKLDIGKYKNKKIINDEDDNVGQVKEILNTMPNNKLRTDQKLKMISNSTTSKFLNNSTNESLSQMCSRVNNNIKSARLSKDKKKTPFYIKIMGKNSHKKNNNKDLINDKSSNIKYNDYTLIYSNKVNNNLDKFNNNDIKKIFGAKGIHIFDVKKNELGIGDMNKINFKIREGDENNIKDLEEKIKMVEIDLNKNKYKVSIKKENIKKKKTVQNNEEKGLNINNEMQNKAYKKKSLLSQLPAVDFKYKNNYKKEK